MKILVTGSSGFVGTHLSKRLQNLGHAVLPFDIVSGQDIRNFTETEEAAKDIDMIYHLAAVPDVDSARTDPKGTFDTNVLGTLSVALGAAKHNVPMQFASSCSAYGNQKEFPTTEESPCMPAELYGISKLTSETLLKHLTHTHGLKVNILRFSTIYGPGMNSKLGMSIFFKKALASEDLPVHGNGLQTRNLLYIDDLIEGLTSFTEYTLTNEIVNFASEEEISALTMAKEIIRITQSKSGILHVEQRPGQTYREKISSARALRLLSWRPKTLFADGLQKTYDSLKNS